MKIAEKFSSIITRINNSTRKKGISVARLFSLIGRSSNYVLTFVAFFLLIVPLPTPPGFSTILALPAIFITIQIICRKDKIWIPNFVAKMRISKNLIKKIDNVSRGYLYKIEKYTKKRLLFIVSGRLQKFYDLLLFVLALMSAIPIPFLCMVPAFAGLLLSIGLIVKDGFITIISLVIAIIGITSIWFSIHTLLTIKNFIFF